MKKRIISLLLVLMMVMTLMPMAALADDPVNDTIEISNADEFESFIENINKTYAYQGQNVVLKADIDLENAELTQNSGNFAGNFDGNGHTVSNFSMTGPLFGSNICAAGSVNNLTVENATLNNTTEDARLGIICRNLNGVMENVNVDNCTISSPTAAVGLVGGLAAMTQPGCTAEDCKVSNLTVTATSAVGIGGAFGGLIGNENTKISNVKTEGITINAPKETPMSSIYAYKQNQNGVLNETNINFTGEETIAVVITNCGAEYRFADLETAMANAEPDEDGVITYYICGKANINGNGSTDNEWIQVAKSGIENVTAVKFVGATDNAEICLAKSNAILADQNYDIDLSFESLTLSRSAFGYASDIAQGGNYFTAWLRDTNASENTVTYSHCVFPNGVVNNHYGKTVFDACSFKNVSDGMYGLWVYASESDTTVNKSTFEGARGVKIYQEGATAATENFGDGCNLTIKDTTFNQLSKKSAILASVKADVKLDNVSVVGCTNGILTRDLSGSDEAIINFNGNGIDAVIAIGEGTVYKTGELSITGGTFNADPSDYVAAGYCVTANDDDTYTVHKHSYVNGKCEFCGDKDPNYVPPRPVHSHSYTATVVAPTCTEQGYTLHKCSCGANYKDTYVKAAGHTTELQNVKAATCTEVGYSGDKVCTVCKQTIEKGTEVKATGHSYTDVVTAPTCLEKGFTTHTCACGDVKVDTYVDALGHDFKDGVCTRCGAKDVTFNPFKDVDRTTHADYYNAILWGYSTGVIKGVSDTEFDPDRICTRAEIVTMLYRLDGENAVKTGTQFTDLTQNWYKDAIAWAVAEKITKGTSDTTFTPDAPCTRAQTVTFLYRYFA